MDRNSSPELSSSIQEADYERESTEDKFSFICCETVIECEEFPNREKKALSKKSAKVP